MSASRLPDVHPDGSYDPRRDRSFLGHPKGLGMLFGVEMMERFSYYGMKAILLYYLTATVLDGGLGIETARAEQIVNLYGAVVYLLPVIGGVLGDRVFGPRAMTFWGGVIIMLGHISLGLHGATFTWLGISLVAFGTGLLKPNLSTIVGNLYTQEDRRRDAGFQIFYLSINIGAFFAPLVTGALSKSISYHAGFLAAAIGMAVALVIYVVGLKSLHGRSAVAPNPLHPGEGVKLGGVAAACLAACVVIYVVVAAMEGSLGSFSFPALINSVTLVIIAAPIIYFTIILRSKEITAAERTHMLAYIPLWVGGVLFFGIFEQAGVKMSTFAKENTVETLFGFTVSPAFYQAVNPAFILLLTPIFAWLWTARAGRFPSLPAKFAISVALIGLSAFMMGWAFAAFPGGQDGLRAGVMVLVGVYFVQTVAELFLSPIGLSATTMLAPKAFTAQLVALWFLTSSVGQALSAQLMLRMEGMSSTAFFYVIGGMAAAVAVLLFVLTPWIRRKIADVEDAQRHDADAHGGHHTPVQTRTTV